MPTPYAVALISAPDQKTADKVTSVLLEEKLAACVNQIPNVRSRYRWKDKIEESQEILLIAKTKMRLLPRITQAVRENHSYDVPEIIGLAIADGYRPYLDWLGANTLFTAARATIIDDQEAPRGSARD